MKTTLQKIILVLALCIGLTSIAKAQMVFIPDTAFSAYLNTNYPTCMVGDSIDGSCPQVINTTFLYVFGQYRCYSALHHFAIRYGEQHWRSVRSSVRYITSIESFTLKLNYLKILCVEFICYYEFNICGLFMGVLFRF